MASVSLKAITLWALGCALALLIYTPAIAVSQETSAPENPIRFFTHNLGDAAYIGADGFLHGHPHMGRRAFFVEIVRAMMEEAGSVQPIQEVSISRGFSLLMQGNSAFFNVARTEERSDRYKWVGPVAIFSLYFYEHKERPTGIKSLEDAKSINAICVVTSHVRVSYLTQRGFKNLLKTPSNENCANLLTFGRVDLISASYYPWFASDPQLSNQIKRTPVVITEHSANIAFSKNLPDAVVAHWQQALDRVKNSPRYEQIRTTYLVPAEWRD